MELRGEPMRRVAILLVVIGIAGPSFAEAQERRAPNGCSAIEVTAPALRRQPREARFSTRQVLDLDFETRLERKLPAGDHVLHFKVVTPGGFLYQDLAMPFTWEKPGRRGKSVVAPAATARGVPVQVLGNPRAGRGPARPSLRARLPVAGTSITMSSLYGRWTVQAFLDDQTRPCSPPRVFAIQSK
jgi:hypothetical protein